ncbi:hypothetical protein [Mucilaginibacter sp.]|uniref:hypothetical protein n=1 Tax=Mucilaginibacter sp. TaxID=1882438 RepID=UPI00326632B6
MKSIYLSIKKLKGALILLVVFFLLHGASLYGQTVNIVLNVLPPYSPYYSDYSGPNASKVLLMLQNLSTTPISIKLVGQLEGDNGIRLTTKSNYVPLSPINLGPNESKQLNGLALPDIFDLNTLNVYGVDKSRLVYTSRLPEGNYSLCIQAVDMKTNKVLSSTAPLGCTNIAIAYPEAPILLGPMPDKIFQNATNAPQVIPFVWANAGYAPPATQYILQVAEMPDVATNPNQVLNATSFPLINKTLSTQTYILSAMDPPLKLNKRYAWRVKAFDAAGKVVFKNNGVSPASIFTYKGPEVLLPAPNITAPLANASFMQLKGLLTPTQPNISFAWDGAAPAAGLVRYGIKIGKITNDTTPPQQFLDNNVQIVLNDTTTATTYDITGPPVSNSSFGKQNFGVLNGEHRVKLDTGATYAVQITAKLPKGSFDRFANLGRSEIILFKYLPLPKPVVEATPTYSTITGKYTYRYKDGNEQPNIIPFSFPKTSKKVLNTSTLTYTNEYNYDALMPEFICANFYNKKNGDRPLKNARLKLVYTVLTTTVSAPSKYSDFHAMSDEEIFNYSNTSALFGTLQAKADRVVKTVTTDENGNFSMSFLNDYKLGLLDANKVEDQKMTKSYDKYGKAKEVYTPTGTSTTTFTYGVMRIAVAEQEFCNSDIILFPQPGKTTVLPEEVILVWSHNLEITLRSTTKIADQALEKGTVVAGYPVRLNATSWSYPLSTSSYPYEGKIEDYIALTPDVQGQPAKVIDLGKTDAMGKITFYNLSSAKKIVQALDQKYEGNLAYELQDALLYDDSGVKKDMGFQYDGNFSTDKLNSTCYVGTSKKEIILTPKKPEIYLRALAVQNGVSKGIAGAKVTITEYLNDSWIASLFAKVTTVPTDENGYVHLKDLAVNTELQGSEVKVTGPLRTIVISKPGYVDKIVSTKQKILFGERYPAQVEQVMVGSGKIVGHVVNEKGEPVICNVRVGNGPYIKTASNGWYSIENCEAGSNAYVQIEPAVDNYFREAFYANIKFNEYTLVGNVAGDGTGLTIVKEKLHRVQFKIVDEYGKPVPQSTTIVTSNNQTPYPSNQLGLTSAMALASPDNEFHVIITANGFVSYDDYIEIPIAKTASVVPITMKKGQVFSGYVYDKVTKKPVANARVYSVSGSNGDGEIQNETYTDNTGHYNLPGVINAGTYMQMYDAYLQYPSKIYAVKSGAPGYIRDMQDVQGLNGAGTATFYLAPLNASAKIWGLDVELNEPPHLTAGSIKISGSFVKLPANANFKTTIANARLPFTDLEVKIANSGGGLLATEQTIKPVASSIQLQRSSFNVTAFDQYACEILGTDVQYQYQPLTITNNNGSGTLNGYLTSELGSFNFSYNYTGKFQLKDYIRTPGKVPGPLPIMAANNSYVAKTKFGVTPLYGKSRFSIHNFAATLSPGGSYFEKAGFNLASDIKLQIPLVGVSTLPAGFIRVSPNNIVWQEYDGNINLPLETWAVNGTGLRYDVNQGGFRVTNGSLQTDLPNVPLKDLIIMPTSIDLGANSLTGKEAISLGGVTPLNLTPGTKITLNYDAAAPFDQKPHYRINFTNTSKTVASINNLPNLATGDKIDINMLSSYSDGQHRQVLVDAAKHTYYNVIAQTISGIEVGKDYFTLVGNTDLMIPGANSNVTGRFRFYKNFFDPKADPATGIVCAVDKLQTDIEMPGKVKYNGQKFELAKDLLKVTGEVLIYKNSIADAIPPVQGIITKTPGATSMAIPEGQLIAMGGSSKKLYITTGGNKVEGPKWNLLKFTAKPEGFNNADSTGKSVSVLKPGADLIDFEVNGAVASVKGEAIELQGITTPFGDLALTLDFEQKILQGTLKIEGANIVLGPVTINDGLINMQIDGKGFIIAGAITNAKLTPLPILGVIKSGIALGFYDAALPQYMYNDLLSVTLYNELPQINNGLKGFYVNVMKSLSKKDLPQLPGMPMDIPGLNAFTPNFDFSAGIDLHTSLNIKDGVKVNIGGKAFAQASCLYNFELCSLGLAGGADAYIDLTYTGTNLAGVVGFGVKASLIYCVGQLDLGLNLELKKELAEDFKFHVHLTK